MLSLTPEILKSAIPSATEDNCELYALPLRRACALYGVDTLDGVSCLLAQVGHESASLSAVSENLNYSASALRKVFGKYFPTDALAQDYARQPERIANRVYANRMGNADESSGDGWRYRGRGLIQLTGRYNYAQVTNQMVGTDGIDFTAKPDLLTTPEWATMSALWYWDSRGLTALANEVGGDATSDAFLRITKLINGGYNGLEDRQSRYRTAYRALSEL